MLGTLSELCRGQMSHICDISALRVKNQYNYIRQCTITITLKIIIIIIITIIITTYLNHVIYYHYYYLKNHYNYYYNYYLPKSCNILPLLLP